MHKPNSGCITSCKYPASVTPYKQEVAALMHWLTVRPFPSLSDRSDVHSMSRRIARQKCVGCPHATAFYTSELFSERRAGAGSPNRSSNILRTTSDANLHPEQVLPDRAAYLNATTRLTRSINTNTRFPHPYQYVPTCAAKRTAACETRVPGSA